jgi:hypothetical protein
MDLRTFRLPTGSPLARTFMIEGVLCAIGAAMVLVGASSSPALVVVGVTLFILGGVVGVVALVGARRGKST